MEGEKNRKAKKIWKKAMVEESDGRINWRLRKTNGRRNFKRTFMVPAAVVKTTLLMHLCLMNASCIWSSKYFP